MERLGSLVYLVGLVESPDNQITDLKFIKNRLPYIYEVEEQQRKARDLLQFQKNVKPFPEGYYPQTPVMLTKAWSPIGAMLERGLRPVVLKRDPGFQAIASGIWEAASFEDASQINTSKTPEELFWAILTEAFRRARERKMYVSIVANPGWDYENGIDSLPTWSQAEITKADRILWRRTP